jgi:hypothetical protein
VKKFINTVCEIFWRIQVPPFLLLSEATQEKRGLPGVACRMMGSYDCKKFESAFVCSVMA